MRSVPPRGSGWVLGKELGLIEHECNRPTRYRVVVLTSWTHPSPFTPQIAPHRFGGLVYASLKSTMVALRSAIKSSSLAAWLINSMRACVSVGAFINDSLEA